MIQRIQSVWLLAAAFCVGLTFKFPFYSGNKTPADASGEIKKIIASSNFLLLILSAILLAGCLYIIFLYKNRKLQLNLAIVTFAISIINIIIYFAEIKKFSSGTISLTSIFVFVIPFFLFLAVRGIWKDKKLVKDLDRLR